MKKATPKQIARLAASSRVSFEKFMRRDSVFSRKDFSYSLRETVWDEASGWDYYYGGSCEVANEHYAEHCAKVLAERGLDMSLLKDPDIAEQFESDVHRAYCDAYRDAEECALLDLMESDIMDGIERSGASHYCFVRITKGHTYEPADSVWEATDVMLGWTWEAHRGLYANLQFYDKDSIDSDVDSALDDATPRYKEYDLNEYPDEAHVIEMFKDYNETEYLIKQRMEVWAFARRFSEATGMTNGAQA